VDRIGSGVRVIASFENITRRVLSYGGLRGVTAWRVIVRGRFDLLSLEAELPVHSC